MKTVEIHVQIFDCLMKNLETIINDLGKELGGKIRPPTKYLEFLECGRKLLPDLEAALKRHKRNQPTVAFTF